MNFHSQIMNIAVEADKLPKAISAASERVAYKEGHRDARHAAAELALKADGLADALRDIVKQDPIELALDPQWAQRIARIALTAAGCAA